MNLPTTTTILVARHPVDFRKSFDGLSGVVREVLRQDPYSPRLFVFRNKRADQLRILWWDGTGLCLWMKRLEQGTFRFPSGEGAQGTLTALELSRLLTGSERGQRKSQKH